MYDQFVPKVNGIESKNPSTIGLVNKSQYETNKQNLVNRDWTCWLKSTRH